MVTETKTVKGGACCGVDADAHVATADTTLADTATIFKALSDETRLRIVRSLAHSRESLCECEIVPQFGLSQSTISYHIKVLREAGIVDCEKKGLWTYCRVNPRALMAAVKTLADLA